ncbi:hypothetical protein OG21DRAFT_1483054 [Imleria badia]|nr:hypothetical protein OG21DRAFT_1483054 [Imleria badia]
MRIASTLVYIAFHLSFAAVAPIPQDDAAATNDCINSSRSIRLLGLPAPPSPYPPGVSPLAGVLANTLGDVNPANPNAVVPGKQDYRTK